MKNYPWRAPGGYPATRGPLIFLDKSKGLCSHGTRGGEPLYKKLTGVIVAFGGFVVWYLSKVWRYLLASFRVLSENIELVPLSGKIVQATATKQIMVPFSGNFQNL